MRTKIIAGNWKMNTTLADAHVLANGVRQEVEHLEKIITLLFPPTIWLTELARELPVGVLPHLKLGAQNMYTEEKGAFTGETSPLMVREVAEYILLGHSERTHLFHEDPDLIAAKLQSAFAHGLKPVLCLGEDEQTTTSKRHLVHMLDHLIQELSAEQIGDLVVAYEPVWAIGSGNPATPEYAQDICSALRSALTEKTRILYGGSVTDENARAFLEEPDLDGLLIGGTSLKLKPFVTICQIAEQLS